MFEGIGKINSYLQQQSLQTLTEDKSSQTKETQKDSSQPDSIVDIMLSTTSSADGTTQRVAAIRKKLMNGRELTDEELHYLEKNSPDLYEKAMKVKEVREQLREDLKHAKTKAEAQRAVTRAQVSVAASAKAELSGAGGITAGAGTAAAGASSAADTGSSADAAGGTTAIPIQAGNTGDAMNVSLTAASPAPEAAALSSAEGADAAGLAPAAISGDAMAAAAGSGTAAAGAAGSVSETTSESSQVYDKYVMQIRGIQDEWQKFTRTKGYKQLPENYHK